MECTTCLEIETVSVKIQPFFSFHCFDKQSNFRHVCFAYEQISTFLRICHRAYFSLWNTQTFTSSKSSFTNIAVSMHLSIFVKISLSSPVFCRIVPMWADSLCWSLYFYMFIVSLLSYLAMFCVFHIHLLVCNVKT